MAFDRGNFEYRFANVDEPFVRPIAFDREFPLQSQYGYFCTGYDLSVSNRVDEATGVQFFAAAFKEASTAGNPADKDGASMVFASPQCSDDELRAIPDQGVWTVEWVHANPEKQNARQSYRTTGRAPTLGEIRSLKLAQFSPALKAAWLARDDVKAISGMVFGAPSAATPSFVDVSTANGGEGWTVPDGALFPVSGSAFGRAGLDHGAVQPHPAAAGAGESAGLLPTQRVTAAPRRRPVGRRSVETLISINAGQGTGA